LNFPLPFRKDPLTTLLLLSPLSSSLYSTEHPSRKIPQTLLKAPRGFFLSQISDHYLSFHRAVTPFPQRLARHRNSVHIAFISRPFLFFLLDTFTIQSSPGFFCVSLFIRNRIARLIFTPVRKRQFFQTLSFFFLSRTPLRYEASLATTRRLRSDPSCLALREGSFFGISSFPLLVEVQFPPPNESRSPTPPLEGMVSRETDLPPVDLGQVPRQIFTSPLVFPPSELHIV